jgi:tetratricopeptide (TPR) repeat protein
MVWRAMRALLDGRLDDADTLAREALAAGSHGETVTAPQYYAGQLLAIRREQARMAELEGPAREFVASNPTRPTWRIALMTLLWETGRIDEAREEFEALAAHDFADIPEDGDWLTAITLLAEGAVALGDRERAARLHELLLPYGAGNVVIGLAAVCLGAAARFLGGLAATVGNTDEAAKHYRLALEANTALKTPLYLAHTQLDYAALLGPGSEASELIEEATRTAERLGLPKVKQRIAQLR